MLCKYDSLLLLTMVVCGARYVGVSVFSFNVMIQYWLLCVSIHWDGELLSEPGFSLLSNFKQL